MHPLPQIIRHRMTEGLEFIPDLSKDYTSQTVYSEQNQVGRTV